MKLYSVINVDIINSRKLKNRTTIQDKLDSFIKNLSIELKSILGAPITLTLGDEWQIFLTHPQKSYYVIHRFQMFLKTFDINIYAGIGIGGISTKVYDDTRIMDGECFIKAREAIDIAKSKFYNEKINSNKNKIFFNSVQVPLLDSPVADEVLREVAITDLDSSQDYKKSYDDLTINSMINSLIENTEILKRKITPKQLEMINLYEKMGSYNRIIENFDNISKAGISQKITASNYFVIKHNLFLIEQLIMTYSIKRKDC